MPRPVQIQQAAVRILQTAAQRTLRFTSPDKRALEADRWALIRQRRAIVDTGHPAASEAASVEIGRVVLDPNGKGAVYPGGECSYYFTAAPLANSRLARLALRAGVDLDAEAAPSQGALPAERPDIDASVAAAFDALGAANVETHTAPQPEPSDDELLKRIGF